MNELSNNRNIIDRGWLGFKILISSSNFSLRNCLFPVIMEIAMVICFDQLVLSLLGNKILAVIGTVVNHHKKKYGK